MFGEVTARDFDLAASTDPTPAADAVEIDPEATRCGQQGRAGRESSAFAGGYEDDEVIGHGRPLMPASA